jgi:nicotinate-nucleotide adenylyltransferase
MIGVFGGTFDPVHYGHLRPALEVKDIFGLDEIRLIPSAVPPHRPQPVASAAMRCEMLALAIANQPGLILDTRELDRPGPSYMVDTLASLRLDFPEQTLLLFIGTDAFNHFSHWHRWQDLFAFAHVVVMTRPGFTVQEIDGFFADKLAGSKHELFLNQAGKLFFQAVTPLDISASMIRRLFAEGHNPGFLLPDLVIDFIRRQGLYGALTL